MLLLLLLLRLLLLPLDTAPKGDTAPLRAAVDLVRHDMVLRDRLRGNSVCPSVVFRVDLGPLHVLSQEDVSLCQCSLDPPFR